MNRSRNCLLSSVLVAGILAMASGAALADACTEAQPGALPADAAELLGALPADVQAGFEGYGSPVVASPFADFKAPSEKPWTIGYNNSFSGNAWRAAALAELGRTSRSTRRWGWSTTDRHRQQRRHAHPDPADALADPARRRRHIRSPARRRR
jgi:hypothetical protein